MEFRLVYEGPLRSNGDAKEKQEIRRQLRPQLEVLWGQQPLTTVRQSKDLTFIRSVGQFNFFPLVTDELRLVCALDVLFLRPEAPGSMVGYGGDLDNRIKTLFDALRMPAKSGELPSGDRPQVGENPFHVLLEDDRLVTEVNITSDRLLRPPAGRNTDVMLVIKVQPRVTMGTYGNAVLR